MPKSEIMNIRRMVLNGALGWSSNKKDPNDLTALAKQIIPDGAARYRCCIHKERAVVEERLRTIFKPDNGPVVRVLNEGCNGCEMHRYVVTDRCQNCVGHFCAANCHKKSILFINDKAYINQNSCVECGLCAKNCPFNAILELRRPCEEGCPTKAISVRENGVARIDEEHCSSCGKCIVNCPFGAVMDTSDLIKLYQDLLHANHPIYAVMAPAFVGQFGGKVSPGQIKSSLIKLGFTDVLEVAIGADMTIKLEAEEYKERSSQGEPLMTSSCCPAYVLSVKKEKPELAEYISTTPSPMVLIAKMFKENDPQAKIAFIGPCIAKKEEGRNPAGNVDFVITFEELAIWMEFMEIDPLLEPDQILEGPTSKARGFAKAGGVSQALSAYLKDASPQTFQAEGINNCLSTLEKLVQNKEQGFLECMACEGGCIGGPRTLINRPVAERALKSFVQG